MNVSVIDQGLAVVLRLDPNAQILPIAIALRDLGRSILNNALACLLDKHIDKQTLVVDIAVNELGSDLEWEMSGSVSHVKPRSIWQWVSLVQFNQVADASSVKIY